RNSLEPDARSTMPADAVTPITGSSLPLCQRCTHKVCAACEQRVRGVEHQRGSGMADDHLHYGRLGAAATMEVDEHRRVGGQEPANGARQAHRALHQISSHHLERLPRTSALHWDGASFGRSKEPPAESWRTEVST